MNILLSIKKGQTPYKISHLTWNQLKAYMEAEKRIPRTGKVSRLYFNVESLIRSPLIKNAFC